jgi:hypothetical protein
MALIGKLVKVAYKMTPKRKAALAKAVAASAKKRGSKAVTKKVVKTTAIKKAASSVKKTAKLTALKTKRSTKAVLKTKAGKIAAATAGGAGVERVTSKKANSKKNKSTTIARANQIGGGLKNLGVKAATDAASVAKNVAKAAVGKQSGKKAFFNIAKDVAASNLKVSAGLVKGQLNVKRAKKNKRK